MNRLAIGAAVVALGGISGALCAAEPTDMPKGTLPAPWYKRLLGIGPEPPKPVPMPPRDPAKVAAADRARAENDLDRRLRVCDQLRQVAFDNGDRELESRAHELERQAWELYKQQTAHLPCSRLIPSQEERILDQKLGTNRAMASAEKLSTPAISVPSRKAQASAIREVKP